MSIADEARKRINELEQSGIDTGPIGDALDALASRKPGAAPSDTDREALVLDMYRVLLAHSGEEITDSRYQRERFERMAVAAVALMEAASRTSQPVQVEREKVLEEVLANLADQGWDVAIADDPVKGLSIEVQPVQVEVTTVRQMRELPRDTVVLSRSGSAHTRTDEGWRSWYSDKPLSDELMFDPWMLGGPFTVVHRPAAALGGGE